ncbi:MAG: hypothetical protein U9Q99_00050 [Nanoarchaeota archaeon]|nr:hypothetical protein [Nanoarchaeota archaeon]
MNNEKWDTIERFKLKAEFFLLNNIKAFIKDYNDTYYSCDILIVGDAKLFIYDFIKKKKKQLLWIDIKQFLEYEVRK